MKLHLKLTSVLLSAVMCASMVMAPVSVIADETSAPEETQTTEATEKEETKETEKKPPKATEKTEPEETKETEPEEKKPAESNKEEPSEPATTSESKKEDVPETTVTPETGGKDDTHSVAPKNANTSITSVSITLDAPAVGAKPDYTAVFPSGANYYSADNNDGYYRNNICWSDAETGDDVHPGTGVFEAGHAYRVVVYLTAKSGYTFTDSTTATLNGKTVEISSMDEHLKLTYTFPKLDGETVSDIYSVSITLDAPAVGAKPDYTAVFPSGANYYSADNNDGYYRNNICWSDAETGDDVHPGTGVFEAGHAYRVVVYLTAKSGYTFTDSTTATLNGKTVEISSMDEHLKLTYTFPKLDGETVSDIYSVSITLDAPEVGAKPDYTAVFPSGVKYYSDAYNGGKYRNDICWKDNTTNSYMNPENDVFKAGHQYFVAVYLTAKDGYEFSYDTTATLNGQNAEIEMDGDQLIVKYTFETITSANTLSVKPKTAKVKYKKLRKKKQTVARSKVMTVSNPQGNVTYKLIGVKRGKSKKYKKYFKINATTGNVSIKKKLRKGTYKITCTVTASGNSEYKSGTKTVTFKIKVK